MRHTVTILFLISLINSVWGQGKYDANWCFGVRAGINFSDTANPANFVTSNNSVLSSASISDSLGNLLLYLAPDTPFFTQAAYLSLNAIYGANNVEISNGDSIKEGFEMAGGVFVPCPSNKSKYFLFYLSRMDSVTNSGIYIYDSLFYAEIVRDSSGFSVVKKNQQLLPDPVEDGIVAIKHANGIDWWLLVHRCNKEIPSDSTSLFYRFLITGDSIMGPFEQNVGSAHVGNYTNGAEIISSRDANWVVCPLDDQSNSDLFNFDPCTGELFNYTSINNNSGALTEGAGFSENGKKLYLIQGGEFGPSAYTSAIYQYSLDSPNIAASRIVIYDSLTTSFSFGDICLAPNNKMYVGVGNNGAPPYATADFDSSNQYLWVINDPDSTGAACNFQPYGYYMGAWARGYGGLLNMPNYNLAAISIYQANAGTDTSMCQYDTAGILIGTPAVAGVSYAWHGVGLSDTIVAQPTVRPTQNEWYYLTVTDTTIQYSCQSTTDSVYVQIIPYDSTALYQTSAGKDTSLCNADTTIKIVTVGDTSVPGIAYTWQIVPGQMDSDSVSIHSSFIRVYPTQSRWYYVTFTDTSSCGSGHSRTDSVYVAVKICTGIDEVQQSPIKVYPNPANDKLIVETSSAKATSFTLYDVIGQPVLQQTLSDRKTFIDITSLSPGLYLYRINNIAGKVQVVR